jgi:hypothetical protein
MFVKFGWTPRKLSQPHFEISVRVKSTLPKVGSWSFPGLSKNSEPKFKGQISWHLSFLYVVGEVLKCRCPKWPRMNHLDICSQSYGQKKGQESNWQFDSRPVKVGNRPLPDVCSKNATWRWKALEESYNFGSNLVSIQAQARSYGCPKSRESKLGQFRDSTLGVPGKIAIWM